MTPRKPPPCISNPFSRTTGSLTQSSYRRLLHKHPVPRCQTHTPRLLHPTANPSPAPSVSSALRHRDNTVNRQLSQLSLVLTPCACHVNTLDSVRMSDLRVARWLETFLTYGLSCLAVIHRLWVGLLANACTVLASMFA